MSIDLLDRIAEYLQFQSIDHRSAKVLLAVEPEPEALVHAAQLWTPACAIEPKIPSTFGARKLQCVREQNLRKAAPLRSRVHSDSVDESGRAGLDLRPIDHIIELEADAARRACGPTCQTATNSETSRIAQVDIHLAPTPVFSREILAT